MLLDLILKDNIIAQRVYWTSKKAPKKITSKSYLQKNKIHQLHI